MMAMMAWKVKDGGGRKLVLLTMMVVIVLDVESGLVTRQASKQQATTFPILKMRATTRPIQVVTDLVTPIIHTSYRREAHIY